MYNLDQSKPLASTLPSPSSYNKSVAIAIAAWRHFAGFGSIFFHFFLSGPRQWPPLRIFWY